MKKFAIAGAVLAVAVLIGYTSTTTILGNNVGNDKFLAEVTPLPGTFVLPAASTSPSTNTSSSSKQDPCGDCITEETAVSKAQKYIDKFIRDISNGGRVYAPNEKFPIETIAEMTSMIKVLDKAKLKAQIALSICKENLAKNQKAYCEGYEAAKAGKANPYKKPAKAAGKYKESSAPSSNLIQEN